jgi:hypothetical protein
MWYSGAATSCLRQTRGYLHFLLRDHRTVHRRTIDEEDIVLRRTRERSGSSRSVKTGDVFPTRVRPNRSRSDALRRSRVWNRRSSGRRARADPFDAVWHNACSRNCHPGGTALPWFTPRPSRRFRTGSTLPLGGPADAGTPPNRRRERRGGQDHTARCVRTLS